MAKKKPPAPDPSPSPEGGPEKPKGPARPKKPKAPPKVGGRPDAVPSVGDRARAMVAVAAKSDNPTVRTEVAKRAIEIDPDCVEAYLLMGEEARSRKQAVGWFEKAVAAAERVLGPEIFVEAAGHFWGLIETRPYMRARVELAEALWATGQRDEATDHVRDMIKLNPGDNQGLRYTLAGWLLNLDKLDELDALLDQYDETSSTWAYTRTLLSFRRDGDSAESSRRLQAARKANKHVPDYLLGRKPIPPSQPNYYSPGDEDDAILYVGGHLGAWKSVPGAMVWLRSKVKDPRAKKPKPSKSVGPSPASVDRLARLPVEFDSWQADFRQFARRVEIAGQRVRPWVILVSSRTQETVMAHAMTDARPTPAAIWETIARAMETPADGKPHRPTELQILPGPDWDVLEPSLRSIGVACVPSEVLDQVDFLFESLTRHLTSGDPPGLLDMPGVTVEQVAHLYQSAAAFYRRAPWRVLGFEAVAKVECDRYESGPWYAVVMGQSGLTIGLALYEDLSLLRKMWAGKLSDEEGARKTVALTVTFDDESGMTEADLEAIERYQWPMASPEAYPSIFRKERGLSMRPPLSWEIDLMDACLRALPDFIARRPPDDPTRELVPVSGVNGKVELRLGWIEGPK